MEIPHRNHGISRAVHMALIDITAHEIVYLHARSHHSFGCSGETNSLRNGNGTGKGIKGTHVVTG
jgi:hypothetical protein